MNLGLLISLLVVTSVGVVVGIGIGICGLVFQRRIARDIYKLATTIRSDAQQARKMAETLMEVNHHPRDPRLPYEQNHD